MKKVLPIVCALGLILLSSCKTQSNNQDTSNGTRDTPTDSSTSASASTSNSSFPASGVVVQPSSALFSLTDTDADVYDAAILACSQKNLSTYVYLPNLNLIGTYRDNADNTCYVCECHLYMYNFSEGEYQNDFPVGESTLWMGIIVSQDNDKNVQVLVSRDGTLWAESVRELCGPLTELADCIINNNEPEVIRHIPDLSQEELLQLYLNSLS